MNGNAYNLPESWLAPLGGEDPSGWLGVFAASPKQAARNLIRDAFYFGPLNLTERAQLLSGWLDRLGNIDGFAERLDAEFTEWVEENWGRFDRPAFVLVSDWSCVCGVVGYSAKLPRESRLSRCATALRSRFNEGGRFLGNFSTAPSADPLGLYLAAIAEFQEDRSLAAFWHRMCDLPDGVPFYHASYAMMGLRRLKAEDPADQGTLRAEVVLGLLRLARAFDRLIRERNLAPHIAENTFHRVAANTALAYRDSPRWVEYGLGELEKLPERSRRWVVKAVRHLAEAERINESARRGHGHTKRPKRTRSIEPDPSWSRRAKELISAIRNGQTSLLRDLEALLSEQRSFAKSTGDTYFVVRTLCNAASRLSRVRPEGSLRWALEARQWEPSNAFTWNIIRDSLLRHRKVEAAISFAWAASSRFAENVFVHTGLAELLRAAHKYEEAELIYRKTVRHFPLNVVCRNSLAEVLKAAYRYDEAEAVYRDTMKYFPEDDFARNGLAELLKKTERFEEAEGVYRDTVRRFSENVVARTGLAELLKETERYEEAESLFRKAIELSDKDIVARNGLADTLKRAGRWQEAEAEYRHSMEIRLWDKATLGGLAFLLLRKGETGRREAFELADAVLGVDPGNQYALKLLNELQSASSGDLAKMAEEWNRLAESASETESTFSEEADYDEEGQIEEGPHAEYSGSETPEAETGELTTTWTSGSVQEREERENIGQLPETGEGGEEKRQVERKEREFELAGEAELSVYSGKAWSNDELETLESDRELSELDAAVESIRVEALVAEAYFYRTWAARAEGEIAASRRRKAEDLLAQAERIAPEDAGVLAQRAALRADQGDEAQAYERLTAEVASHSAAAPLLVIKARLDRRRARKEERPLTDSSLRELTASPQQLRDLSSLLEPLFHFQKGLAALSLMDGSARLDTAASEFTRFRKILAGRAKEERADREKGRDKREREHLRFHEWLYATANGRLFESIGSDAAIAADDIPGVETTFAKRASEVDEIEDLFANRLSLAAAL